MSVVLALARREGRLIRDAVVALALLSAIAPVVPALSPSAESEATPLVVATCALLAALVLGAGTFAGEPAPGFLAARPVHPVASVAVRLSVRALALLGLALLAAAWAIATSADVTLRVAECAASVLAAAFLAAALVSALVRRPLTAALGALALVLAVALALALAAESVARTSRLATGAAFEDLATSSAAWSLPVLLVAVLALASARSDQGRRIAELRRLTLAAPMVAALSLLLAWLVGGTLLGVIALAWQERAWARAFPVETRPMRTSASPDALRAARLASDVGLPLHRLPRPLRARAHDAPGWPELRRLLAFGDLQWESTWPREGFIASGGTVLRLGDALVAEARESAGAPAIVAEDLLALRALTVSLGRLSSHDARENALRLSIVHARAAREIRTAPPGWAEDEDVDVLRRAALESIPWEVARRPHRGVEVVDSRERRSRWRVVGRMLASPVTRWQQAAALRRSLPTARRAVAAETCDLLEREAPPSETDSSVDAWPAWTARLASEAAIEWELTRTVIEVRDHLRAQASDPPASLLTSTTCPGRSWSFQRFPGGWIVEPWPELTSWDVPDPPPRHVERSGLESPIAVVP